MRKRDNPVISNGFTVAIVTKKNIRVILEPNIFYKIDTD